jgi:hypothetical protein
MHGRASARWGSQRFPSGRPSVPEPTPRLVLRSTDRPYRKHGGRRSVTEQMIHSNAPAQPVATSERLRPVSGTAACPAHVFRLLALQMSAGNHAVAQLFPLPTVQRQPGHDSKSTKVPGKPPRKAVRVPLSPADRQEPDPKLPRLALADLVREVKRDNETWTFTIDVYTSPEKLESAIWPYRRHHGVTVRLNRAVTDPIERGWFVFEGLTPDSLRLMEPSFAKLLADKGLQEEPEESAELQQARAEFHERHKDHGAANLSHIDRALRRVTKRNPELLLAYYRHYAHHKLTDESERTDHIDFDPDKNTGGTAYGDTLIHPDVLAFTSKFPTDDPMSLLGGTLMHEFSHTPQGGGASGAEAAINDAKAFGIELFFAERMGDTKRAAVVSSTTGSSLDKGMGTDKRFWDTYATMRALYEVIDQGGPAAAEARSMSVEFISKNESDYGTKLRQFITTRRRRS